MVPRLKHVANLSAGAVLSPIQNLKNESSPNQGVGNDSPSFFDKVQRGVDTQTLTIESGAKAQPSPKDGQEKASIEKSTDGPKTNIQIENNFSVSNGGVGGSGIDSNYGNREQMAQFRRRLSGPSELSADSGNNDISPSQTAAGITKLNSDNRNNKRELASKKGMENNFPVLPTALISLLITLAGVFIWLKKHNLLPFWMASFLQENSAGSSSEVVKPSQGLEAPSVGNRGLSGYEPTIATSATRVIIPGLKKDSSAKSEPSGFDPSVRKNKRQETRNPL